nr:hypothetical protein [Desulfobulbaceae bacterium]
MHKWQKQDRSTVVLCDQCSKKEYKVLDIREQWKKKELEQEYCCELCGVKQFISRTSSE